jgi:antitoxin (DNA-binding transcriptional repressor) of toxin-antitoxin stability system
MKQVRISELKGRLSAHLRAVEAGETIEVMDRQRSIARIVSIARDSSELELIPAERPFSSVRALRAPRLKKPVNSLAALRAERGSR